MGGLNHSQILTGTEQQCELISAIKQFSLFHLNSFLIYVSIILYIESIMKNVI